MTCKAYDIPKALVWEAWLHVRANQGAAGIDAETIERFETKLVANLYKLWNRMSSGSYFPPAVRAVPIPKKSGGIRILAVGFRRGRHNAPHAACFWGDGRCAELTTHSRSNLSASSSIDI